MTGEAISASATNKVPKGSVVVATRVSLGKVGLATDELCFSQDCQALLFDSGFLDPRYVVYQMRVAVAGFKAISRGTTISGVTKKQLLAVDFLLPPLPEQRRIVAAIEEQFARLDAGVVALERARANLKRYRASVLKAAVEGRLTEQWREQNPGTESGSALLERILEERRAKWEKAQLAKYAGKEQNPPKNWRSKYKEPAAPDTAGLPELPEGWVWILANALIANIRSGSSAVPNDEKIGVPVLRSSSVRPGSVDFADIRYLSDEGLHEENFLREHDVLFTRLSGSLDYVGNCAEVKDLRASRVQYPDRLFCARLVSANFVRYLSLYFASPQARKKIESVAKSTAGHQRISLDGITAHVMPLPLLAEQEEIVAEVERRLSVIEEVEAQVEADLKRAARLRQSIFKRAFEGKLVPQDPTDEPASALLERIREQREQTTAKKPQRKKPGRQIPKASQASLFSPRSD